MTLPDNILSLLDIEAVKQGISQDALILKYCKAGLNKDKLKEKQKDQPLTPGQKAKYILDWWCEEYPKRFNSEKYQVKGGRDMKHLTQIFTVTPDLTSIDIKARLLRYSADPFYAGHPLNQFNPNAWTEAAVAAKKQPQKKLSLAYTKPTGASAMALSEQARKPV